MKSAVFYSCRCCFEERNLVKEFLHKNSIKANDHNQALVPSQLIHLVSEDNLPFYRVASFRLLWLSGNSKFHQVRTAAGTNDVFESKKAFSI